MSADKMSVTELWVRVEAPELLTGPLAEEIGRFIADDDLTGLAEFMQRRVERFQELMAKAADISDEERRIEAEMAMQRKQSVSSDMSADDKQRTVAQLEEDLAAFAELVHEKDQTIRELQEQVHVLRRQQSL